MPSGCPNGPTRSRAAAAQRTDRPAAINVAALSQISFVAFLLGPPPRSPAGRWRCCRCPEAQSPTSK
ncbi:hypothetical protein EOA25_32855 [Mesorhizobium sp. M2A.F.Ca.ET.040.01.1.1]|nr:hypothetical protein EOA25_32855 [Mesorhizobium sp. M2A.F.Ca.ET.040.01.1.1]